MAERAAGVLTSPDDSHLLPVDAPDVALRLEGDHDIELYRFLREQRGHVRTSLPGGIKATVVLIARYSEITQVLKDTATFSSAKGAFSHPEVQRRWGGKVRRLLSDHFNNADPPRHAPLRKVVSGCLSDAALRKHEAELRAHMHVIIREGLIGRSGGDVAAFGLSVTRWTLANVFGVPVDAHEQVVKWSGIMSASTADAGFATAIEAAEEFRELIDCARHVVAVAGEKPESVMGSVARALGDGFITPQQAESYLLLLIIAGLQTTAQTINQALLAFAIYPEEYDAFRSGAVPISLSVDELLRFASVAKQFYRMATRDTVVGSTAIREGEVVSVVFGAGNRDPERFKDGDVLRLARADARHHLSFGAGPHFCTGSWLAKMQIRVFLEEFASVVGRVQQVGDARWYPSPHFAGLQFLPLKFDSLT